MKWHISSALAAGLLLAVMAPAAQASCPNEALRTGPSAHLPDCRAFELVSPSDKNGGSVLASPVTGMSSTPVANVVSPDGRNVFYATETPGAWSEQGGFGLDVATRSSATGWSTRDLAAHPWANQPASFPNELPAPVAISQDMSHLVFLSRYAYNAADQNQGGDLYMTDGATTDWLTGPALDPTADPAAALTAASDDLSRIYFQSSTPLLAGDVGPGTYEWHDGAWSLVAPDEGQPVGFRGMARNGTRVFFTEGAGFSSPGLWVKDEGSPAERLVADPGVNFLGSSADGSKVFFLTSLALTSEDTDAAAGLASNDIYMEDMDTHAIVLVSAQVQPDVSVARTARISDDGEVVYFFANGKLIDGTGRADEQNLFVYDHGATHLVASAVTTDVGDFGASVQVPCSNWRVTPSGDRLAFATSSALVSQDTDSNVDLYVYDLRTKGISLASQGGNGAFDADIGRHENTCWSIPAFELATPAHVLSDDGRYLFFESQEALDTHDVNGTWDVYEYNATTQTTSLISDGRAPEGSLYVGSSASGSDVIFTTAATLTPQDVDTAWDVYDATVNGGFTSDAAAIPGCTEDACQPVISGGPEVGAPGSETHHGFENPKRSDHSRASFHVGFVSQVSRRRFARLGRLRLDVRVSDPGHVAATAEEVSGSAPRVVARAGVTASSAGRVHPELRLSLWARRRLASGHRLRLRVTVTYSNVTTPRYLHILLGTAR